MKRFKRIALISDIHGNVPALSAVLSDIKNNSVDSVICLGDVATLGPEPNKTMKLIMDLDCPCIIGNHEEALLSPDKAHEFKIIGIMLQDTIKWCLNKLDSSEINFLKGFKSSLFVSLGSGKSMLCYHGSPKSSIDSVLPDSHNDYLEQIIDNDSSIKIAVGGHTHFQMLRKYKETIILNPGSVGLSFTNPSYNPPSPSLSPIAEYAVVCIFDDNISVELKSINYDFDKFKALVINSDNPLKEWLMEEFNRIENV
jgi:predicted phosphodiesterase